MATVLFYEKPGCINNAKQKKLIMRAGHDLVAHNLLEMEWDTPGLKKFFSGLPVAEWFNCTAPAVKQGSIDPVKLDEDQALNMMLKDPILIRRPLIQVGDECRVGFDIDKVNKWIGLACEDTAVERHKDIETCTQQR